MYIQDAKETFSIDLVWMEFYVSKNMSAGRYVAPLGHIILISSQPVFVRTPKLCVIREETKNTNFTVFDSGTVVIVIVS
jgi:hypothetical protein